MLTAIECKHRNESVTSDVSNPGSYSANRERRIDESHILIADDEQLNIDVVRRYLEMGGYRNITSTDHAGQILPMMGLHRPDVVL